MKTNFSDEHGNPFNHTIFTELDMDIHVRPHPDRDIYFGGLDGE